MGLQIVDIPRARGIREPLSRERLAEVWDAVRTGSAVSPDDLAYDDRRSAQTEAWRWRHELAAFSDADVATLKSATFADQDGRYRFAVYLAGQQ